MVSQANISINSFFVIFIVCSCIYGFPRELQNEDSDYFNRHLLFEKECSKANLTYGKRESGDLLVDQRTVFKTEIVGEKVEYNLEFDRTDNSPDNITKIEIFNLNKQCKCYRNQVDLYDGGINCTRAKFNFTSEVGCDLDYIITFFAKN